MKTLGATALALLTTLCLSLAALSGWAADPAKLPDGLRGVPWGASLKSLPDMAPVETEEAITHCERRGDKKVLGEIPVNLITYSFFHDQFYHGAIMYEHGRDDIQAVLESKYGPADGTREKKDPAGRTYLVSDWLWPGKVYIGHRRYVDEDGGRIFYFYAPLADASEGRLPQAPPLGTASAKADAERHVLAKGETLAKVAASYGLTSEALLAANPGLDPKKLKPGASLALPWSRSEGATPKKAASGESGEHMDEITAVRNESAAPPASPTPTDVQAPSKAPAAPATEPAPALKADARSDAPARHAGAPEGVYRVKVGDSPSSIAKTLGVSEKELLRLNNIKNPKSLQIDQELRVPGGASKRPPVAAGPSESLAKEPPATSEGAPETPKDAPKAPKSAEVAPADTAASPKDVAPEVQAEPVAQADERASEAGKAVVPAKTRDTESGPGGGREHVIKVGDTPARIAKKYGVSEAELLRANGVANPKTLQIGRKLRIPADKAGPGEKAAGDASLGKKAGQEAASSPAVPKSAEAARPETSVAPESAKPAEPAPTVSAPTAPAVSPGKVADEGKSAASVGSGKEKETATAPDGDAQGAPVKVAGEYVIKPGDSVAGIAKKLKVSEKELLRLNGVTDPKTLQIGQKLKIPGK